MKKILNKLGLTKKELMIIVFLIITFAGGLILKYSNWKNPPDHDYTQSDREFDQRVKTEFDELEKQNLSEQQKIRSDSIKKFADSLITQRDTKKTEGKLTGKININTAYAPDLMLLPGVGPVMAERIVEYREQKGPFKKPEDLMKVKGIGEKKFDQLKQWIVVE